MTKRILLSIGLLLALSLSPANAQEAPRANIDAAKTRRLTLREAITGALNNNRDLEIERVNVQLQEFDLQASKGAFDPKLSTGIYFDHRNTPVASLIAGGENGQVKTTDFTGSTKLTQRTPWQGGSFSASFDQNRATTDNLFYSLNPQFTTSLNIEYTQPLWRNREIDPERRQIKIAQKRLTLSDARFRQRVIEIIANVERAYWDLVFARRDEEIKRESVALAQTQLAQNERKVAQGTMAPAEVVSSRVEIERRTDEAAAAVETIERAENALKTLIAQPGDEEIWNSALVPVEKPEFPVSGTAMPFADAMKLARDNRAEFEQYRLRGEINKIDVAFFKNQTKPQVDFVAGYGTYGLAGKTRTAVNPIVASNELLFGRVNQLSQAAGLPPLPPLLFGTLPESFNGGYGQSLGNLFRNDYRAWRVGMNITLPIGNRMAKAQLGRALAEGRQVDAERQRAEQAIEAEVRNALQAVDTAKRRAEAARNSRSNAELQLASEQHRFDAGLSTNYFVLDRQNALSAARGRELKALTDYNKAMSDLQRALSTTLANNNVTVAVGR